MGWKSTVAQNGIEHHSQPNTRKTTVPKQGRRRSQQMGKNQQPSQHLATQENHGRTLTQSKWEKNQTPNSPQMSWEKHNDNPNRGLNQQEAENVD